MLNSGFAARDQRVNLFLACPSSFFRRRFVLCLRVDEGAGRFLQWNAYHEGAIRRYAKVALQSDGCREAQACGEGEGPRSRGLGVARRGAEPLREPQLFAERQV